MKKLYYSAAEVAEMLGVSLGQAYKIIKRLNTKLAEQGYLVISGKIPRGYLKEQWYGFADEEKAVANNGG